MPNTTPRGYRTPLLVGEGADVPAKMEQLAGDIDADVTAVEQGYADQGLFDDIPAAGNAGRLYRATDSDVIYRDNGIEWEPVPIGSPAFGALGLNSATVNRRGKSIITAEESRTNAAYGLLATPDRVQNITVPADGLLLIAYRALVKQSVLNAARVAIVVGANELKQPSGSGAPVVYPNELGPYVNDYNWLLTAPPTPASSSGLVLIADEGNSSVGGGSPLVGAQFIAVEVAAGTYDVSVQFKASSGSVTAKERKLWVEARGY